MAIFKVGMAQQEASKSQHCRLQTNLVTILSDLVHFNKRMMEAGQPGELPLMRELSSLRRLRSLQDPMMAPNAGGVSSSVQTSSWIPPVSRIRDVRCNRFNAGRSRDMRGSRSPTCNAKTSSQRVDVSHPSPFSHPMNVFEDEEAWDLGMNAEQSLYDVHIKCRPSLEARRGEVIRQQNSSRNSHDGKYSLDGWRDPSWHSDMEASHATSFSVQHPHGMSSHNKNRVVIPASGGAGGHNRYSYGSQNHNLCNRMHGSRRMPEGHRPRVTLNGSSSQHNQVLSPLILNPHEDMHYNGKSFTLEGSSCARPEQSNQVAMSGLFRRDFPLPESDQYSKNATKKSQRGTTKANRKLKHSTASSTSTSQRTASASQSPLSGAWEATSDRLEDELDVCELPKNRCGIPCYWSKSQRRGKSLLDMAERSFACGLYSVSPRRMAHSSSKNYNSQFQGGYPGHEPVPPLDLEALPLLSDPSACSEDILGMSDSDKISSDLNGELGLQYGGAGCAPDEGSVGGRKELAIYRERPRSLSQKYRPKVFDELVGQSFVSQALSNAIQKKKIAPVYLFQGPRGTGKTSAARIFAAALNCTALEQQKPCGSCKDCLAFSSGKSLDIREVDAASNNAVEKVKGLLQTAFLAPSFSQYKIFIIDECHMLTAEGWNVLLKLLEEPPMNVVFILTTTDPDKVPTVAVSRCQKFPFLKIKDMEIVGRLQALVKLENLNVEAGALELVAARADGSLRDAEIILDQLSLLGQRITVSTVHELFGSVSNEKLLGLLDFALCSDMVNTVQRARELIDSGVEPLDLMVQLANLITDILAGNSDMAAVGVFFSKKNLSEEELERLRFALQVLSDSEKQLRAVSNDRATWLTAALLQLGPARTCVVSLSTSSESASASPVVKAFSNDGRQVLKVVNGKNTQNSMVKGPSQKKAHLLTTTGNKSNSLRAGLDVQVHPVEASKVSSAASTAPLDVKRQSVSMCSGRRATLVGPGNLDDIWRNVLERCKTPAVRQLLQSHGKLLAVSISAEGAIVFIEFDSLESKTRSDRWKNALTNPFREVLDLSVELKIALAANATAATSVGSRVQAIVDQQATNSQEESQQNPISTPPEHKHKFAEGGSLHYRRSHSQKASPQLEHTNSIKSFPAILAISKSNKVADSDAAMGSLSSTPCSGSGQKSQKRMESSIFEGMKTGGGSLNVKSRGVFLLQGTQSRERIQEIVVENSCNTWGAEDARGPDKPMSADVFSYDIEEENLRLEAQSKYGGLLCWRNPQVDDDKVSKTHQRGGGCAVLMRLVPCANSERK